MPVTKQEMIQGKMTSITEFPEYATLKSVNYFQGGMSDEEFLICEKIDYSPLFDKNNLSEKYELTNAFHLIQSVFIARICIRLTGGIYWVKFNSDYESNEPDFVATECKLTIHKNSMIQLIEIKNLFLALEPYHPSHRDDILRSIWQFENIFLKLENSQPK